MSTIYLKTYPSRGSLEPTQAAFAFARWGTLQNSPVLCPASVSMADLERKVSVLKDEIDRVVAQGSSKLSRKALRSQAPPGSTGITLKILKGTLPQVALVAPIQHDEDRDLLLSPKCLLISDFKACADRIRNDLELALDEARQALEGFREARALCELSDRSIGSTVDTDVIHSRNRFQDKTLQLSSSLR